MAYKDSERNGVHRDGKKAHPWWATDDEWRGLQDVSASIGCMNVTQLLREIANGTVNCQRVLKD